METKSNMGISLYPTMEAIPGRIKMGQSYAKGNSTKIDAFFNDGFQNQSI